MKLLHTFQRRLTIFRNGESTSIENLERASAKTTRNGTRDIEEDENNSETQDDTQRKKTVNFCYYIPWEMVLLLTCMSIAGVVFPLCFLSFYSLQSKPDKAGMCVSKHDQMFDCFPNVTDMTNELCDFWGCCWQAETKTTPSRCFHRYPSSYAFVACDPNINKTTHLISNHTIRPTLCVKREGMGPLNASDPEYVERKFEVLAEALSEVHIRVRICRNDSAECKPSIAKTKISNVQFNVTFYNYYDNNVVVTVSRKNDPLMNSIFTLNYKGGTMKSHNYTEATVILQNNSSIYGLGFNTRFSFRRPSNLHSWNLLNNFSDFSSGSSLSGVHPVYLCLEKNHSAHGVFFNNSRVMNIEMNPYPALTFRALGGPLDFHIVFGPKPVDVIVQFTNIGVIGKPAMPPYWALGFHLCRTLRDNPEDDAEKKTYSENLFQLMWEKGIPQESDCIDGEAWKLLNFDQTNKRLNNFRDKVMTLRDRTQKVMAVTFPQLPYEMSSQSKSIFNAGNRLGIFVRNSSHDLYFGVFIDYEPVVYADVTQEDKLKEWLTQNFIWKEFDGLLLNWNTPVDIQFKNTSSCPNNYFNLPAYHLPLGGIPLSAGTLCMDSIYDNNDTHSVIHNDYGRRFMAIVNDVQKQKSGKRSFVISLATSTGTGKIGGAWGGEYPSTWENLRMSLVQAFEASLYNIPFFGIPICGAIGPINEDLCLRWFQIGIFYPLALMYYDSTEVDRHPLAFSNSFGNYTKELLQMRYALLPYLYTLFHGAHVRGEPVLRALVFEFPHEHEAPKIDSQFMWGPALMITPCLEEGAKTIKVWMPPGDWYSYYTNHKFDHFIDTFEEEEMSQNRHVELNSPNFFVNLFLRAGYVIVTQNVTDDDKTLSQVRRRHFIVIVTLDSRGKARGDLYLDNGETHDTPSALVSFNCENSVLSISTKETGNVRQDLAKNQINTFVSEVRVLGVTGTVENVVFNDRKATFYKETDTETDITTIIVREIFDLLTDKTIFIRWESS